MLLSMMTVNNIYYIMFIILSLNTYNGRGFPLTEEAALVLFESDFKHSALRLRWDLCVHRTALVQGL